MKVTLEKKDKNQVELEVQVDAPEVAKAYDKAFRLVAREVRIPGFRPGKAPRPLVERTAGVDYIKSQAFEKFLLPEVYPAALEEGKVEPIADPRIELVSFEKDQPLVFKALVEVRPEVTLGAYQAVAIGSPKNEVTDADLDERLAKLAEQKGSLETVERAAALGDTVLADFTGRVDGVEFEGGKATDYSVELAPGRFIAGFVEGFVGMTAGQTKSVDLAFPEDYPNGELAGKPVTFELVAKEVKERRQPAIDDAFAKEFGDSDLAAMRAKLRAAMATEREEAREIELRKQLIDVIVAGSTIDVPETMISRELDFLLQQQAMMLQQQGIDPNRVFTKESVPNWRNNSRPEAEKRIRTSLTLGAIARAEAIAPDESEIEEAIVEYAASYGVDPAQFRNQVIRNGAWPQIADEVLSNKIIEWLFERAQVSDQAVAEPAAANA